MDDTPKTKRGSRLLRRNGGSFIDGKKLYDTVILEDDEIETEEAREARVPLEEWATISWKLPSFIGRLKSYLNNESKEQYEKVPIRTCLLNAGSEISMHSTFLANLYFSPLTGKDHNENSDCKVNLNLQDRPNSMTNPIENDYSAFVSVTLKLVEHSEEEPTHLHYKVVVEAPDIGYKASIVHFFTAVKTDDLLSVAGSLDLETLMKMADDDVLCVTVNVCIYRPPVEWPLTKVDLMRLTTFMTKACIEINDANRQFVNDLAKKCGQQLSGITECLNILIPSQFSNTS